MTWRSTNDMTRDELEDEVQQLRAAVERLIVAAVPADGPVTEPADHHMSVEEGRTYIEDKLSLVRTVTADSENGGIDSPPGPGGNSRADPRTTKPGPGGS